MKCTLCKERNGNTRCEGCNTLFCLPCMNKHHEELVQEFQLLMDARNELKQVLDTRTSCLTEENQKSCLKEINEWEQNTVQRIQEIAIKARTNAKEIMMKYIDDLSDRFQTLSDHIQEQYKEGSYLENDITKVENELNDLKNDIENMKIKIRVDYTKSNHIEWDSLIYIVEEESTNEEISEKIKNTQQSIIHIETKQLESNIIPIHVMNSNLSPDNSFIMDIQQNTDSSNIYPTCSQPTHDDLSSRSTCSIYNANQRISTLHPNFNVSSSTQDIHSPMNDFYFDHNRMISHTLYDNDWLLIYCPHCKTMNFMIQIPSSMNYQCTVCNQCTSVLHH
ncbi:hypothetical protein I4U23_000879 [Adineta vaga]|nr:hypothetical protein I4U23_000879 [Adineta vaga]